MKNKMLKGAHLSERKCREILNLFCEDLTATEIAAITGVSRVTINAYVKMIRTRLALFCEESFPSQILPDNASSFTHGSDELPKTTYYGFTKHEGQIFSTGLNEMSRELVTNWQRQLNGQHSDAMLAIQAVADFTNWRLYRTDMMNTAPLKTSDDDISGFWGLTRNRLMKFRGLNRNTLYLHIKECEFRFNHRNEDLQQKILQLISKHPLHELQYRA